MNQGETTKICGLLLLLSLIAVGVLAFLLVRCNNNKDQFCGTCQGIGNKVCTDRDLLHKLYSKGILTESTALERGKQWPQFSWDKYLSEAMEDSPPEHRK